MKYNHYHLSILNTKTSKPLLFCQTGKARTKRALILSNGRRIEEEKKIDQSITLNVQRRGLGISSANQVVSRAADQHASGCVVDACGVRVRVEGHGAAVQCVGPAVGCDRGVGLTRALQQHTAPLMQHQGLHLHPHLPRSN